MYLRVYSYSHLCSSTCYFHMYIFTSIYSGLYPAHLFASRILKPLQEHLSMLIQTDIGNSAERSSVSVCCVFLGWLHTINKNNDMIIPQTLFNNTGISGMSDTALIEDYNNWKKYRMSIYSNSDSPQIVQPNPVNFFLSDYPFLLSAEAKKR